MGGRDGRTIRNKFLVTAIATAEGQSSVNFSGITRLTGQLLQAP